MKQCILSVPVLHEDRVLRRAVDMLYQEVIPVLSAEGIETTVVIALNGSSEQTHAEARACEKAYPGRVRCVSINESGRGSVLREVVRAYPGADVYAYTDVDIPIAPRDVARLVRSVASGDADCAIVRRAGRRPWMRKIMTAMFRYVSSALLGVDVQDGQGGAKAWSREVAQRDVLQCTERGFFFDVELLSVSMRSGRRIVEIECEWIEQRFVDRKSTVRPLRDSMRALSALWRVAWRTQRTWMVGLSALIIALIGYCALWTTWGGRVESPGFTVAHHLPAFATPLIFSMLAIALVYAFVVIIISRLFIHDGHLRALRGVVLIACACIIMTILFAHPNRSQDVYWNLLLSEGQTALSMNPYQTTPQDLVELSWSDAVRDWRNLAMTHGPVWVYMLQSVTVFTDNLHTALVMLRLWYVAAFIVVVWGVSALISSFLRDARLSMVTFYTLVLNPLWFQHGLIDLHNDVFLAAALVWSAVWAQRRQYVWSIIVLAIGAGIKYTPAILIPIPLLLAWHHRKTLRQYFLTYIPLLFGILSIAAFVYGSFGWFSERPSGVQNEIVERGVSEYELLGRQAFVFLIGDADAARYVAYGIALTVLMLAMYKRAILSAYTLPFVVIFIFATSWFQAWYLLWILPLCIRAPVRWIVICTTAVFLSPDFFMPSMIHWYVLACVCALIGYRYFSAAITSALSGASKAKESV